MEFLPRVTVCIPTYNGEKFIRETLQSVVSQQGVELEIIIGDDLSSDRSLEIARQFASRYSFHNWKILEHRTRLGMAENWNACLRIATHDFVKVMGQDDLIHEGALMNQAILLETNPNVSLVVSGCNILSSGGRKLFTRMRRRCAGVYPGCEVITDCLLHRANLIGEPVTVMARRTDVVTLGGFSPSHRYYIDLEFWIRLLKMGDCAVVKEPQCSFRIHGSALSSACQQTDFNQFDELPGARDFLQTLLPLQRKYRLLNARISTMSRSLVYRIFG